MAANRLIAIDPGAHTGFAVWIRLGDGWRLVECGVTAPNKRGWPQMGGTAGTVCVIEIPVIYPHGKARPADLMKLSRVAGRYEDRFDHCDVHLVEPRQWKGTIPGDVMCARIAAAFDANDRAVFAAYKGGYAHNAVDAIGLGKWAQRQPWCR